jgi:hypothetical protein
MKSSQIGFKHPQQDQDYLVEQLNVCIVDHGDIKLQLRRVL